MFSAKKNLKYRKMQKKIKKHYNRNIFEKKIENLDVQNL